MKKNFIIPLIILILFVICVILSQAFAVPIIPTVDHATLADLPFITP